MAKANVNSGGILGLTKDEAIAVAVTGSEFTRSLDSSMLIAWCNIFVIEGARQRMASTIVQLFGPDGQAVGWGEVATNR